MWRLKGTQDASTNQLYILYRPTTMFSSIKSSTFYYGLIGTTTSASFACFKGTFSFNTEGVKILIFLAWGEFKLWGHQTSHYKRPFSRSVAIYISKHQVKGKTDPPKVSLKDSREMPDTKVMHIEENFSLNDPLLYANLTSYFYMTILLSGLDLLSMWM